MTTETTLRSHYLAATTTELEHTGRLRRVAAITDPRVLFPHRGTIECSRNLLVLHGWRRLTPSDVAIVSRKFVPGYNRFAAGGAWGGFPSLGVFEKFGAPLVLHLRSGERIVLIVGRQPISGATKNTDWLATLREFSAG